MKNYLTKIDDYINNNDSIFIYVAWLFCILLITGAGPKLLYDPDTYWHIRTGLWIIENGSIPITDPFSHSMQGAPWHAHEWASAVLLAISYKIGGWHGVVTLTAFSAAFALLIFAWALSRNLRGFYVGVFTILALMIMKGHLLARPHILVLPVIVLWVTIMVEARAQNKSPPLLAALLIVIWANMHGSFLIGLLIAAVLAAEAFLSACSSLERKRVVLQWGLFLFLSFIASVLTPYGFSGIIFPFQILNMGESLSVIQEWKPPDFRGFNSIGAWLLFALGAILFRGLHLNIFRVILILLFVQLTLTHRRAAEYLGFIVPLLVAYSIAAQWTDAPSKESTGIRHLSSSLKILSGFVTAGALLFLWTRDLAPASKISPEGALEAARQAGVSGNVLNDYNFGGFLIFNRIPVFIDGRADMYGDAFIKRFGQALFVQALTGKKSESDFLNIISDYDIRWAISEPSGALSLSLENLANWKELYRDDTAVVHTRIEE